MLIKMTIVILSEAKNLKTIDYEKNYHIHCSPFAAMRSCAGSELP